MIWKCVLNLMYAFHPSPLKIISLTKIVTKRLVFGLFISCVLTDVIKDVVNALLSVQMFDKDILCDSFRMFLDGYTCLSSKTLDFVMTLARQANIAHRMMNGCGDQPFMLRVIEKFKDLKPNDPGLDVRLRYVKRLLEYSEANMSTKDETGRSAWNALREMKATKFRTAVLQHTGMIDCLCDVV